MVTPEKGRVSLVTTPVIVPVVAWESTIRERKKRENARVERRASIREVDRLALDTVSYGLSV
jgi:hypothetical protein